MSCELAFSDATRPCTDCFHSSCTVQCTVRSHIQVLVGTRGATRRSDGSDEEVCTTKVLLHALHSGKGS